MKASGAAFANAEQGDASLKWFVFKKSPAIKLTVGQQWIVIDPVAAEVVAWRNGRKTPMGGVTPSLGMVGFFDTRNQKAQEYQLAGYKFDKDSANKCFIEFINSLKQENDSLSPLSFLRNKTCHVYSFSKEGSSYTTCITRLSLVLYLEI